jgi:archaellum biogenesis ATPase FlaH
VEGREQRLRFFDALYSECTGGELNLRAIRKDRQKGAVNALVPFSGAQVDAIEKFVRDHDRDGFIGVYYGVGTRNGGGTGDDVIEVPSLWADLDWKHVPDPEARERLKEFPFPPSALVRSGGGLQPYWFLKEPSHKDELQQVVDALLRIAGVLKSDTAVCEVARILRVPGTFNRKPEYGKPRPVTLEYCDAKKRYNWQDIVDLLPAVQPTHKPSGKPSGETIKRIMECAFMRHCDEERTTLSEPEWWAMVTNLVRENGGPDKIHELSKGYPKYSARETEKKIRHALDGGPAGCEVIKGYFDCGKRCGVKAPAGLAFKRITTAGPKRSAFLDLDGLSECFEQQVSWLWRQHVPRAMPVIVNGREGDGKTTICIQMGKEILEENPQAVVIWVASEGFVQDTKTKLEALQVDRKRFLMLQHSSGGFQYNFSLVADQRELDAALLECAENGREVACVFMDSIRGITPFDDNDSKIKNVMTALNSIVCDKHRATLVYIDHHKKGQAATLLDRGVGTTAKAAAVRRVLSVVPVSTYVRKLSLAKSNILGDNPPELLAALTDNDLVIYEAVEQAESSLVGQAQQWLIRMFSERDTYKTLDIYEEGEKFGFTSHTLKKAKQHLSIEAWRKPPGSWFWTCRTFLKETQGSLV